MQNDGFALTKGMVEWAAKGRQGLTKSELLVLLRGQHGRCALSNVEMIFTKRLRTPGEGKGHGCHPLCPAVDHIDPGNKNSRYQIICYALNDLKGALPADCFIALTKTKAWKELMKKWSAQAKKNESDFSAFKRLLRA